MTELEFAVIAIFGTFEILYFLIYSDYLGARYLQKRSERVEKPFETVTAFSISLFALPVFFFLSVYYPEQMAGIVYELSLGDAVVGFSLSAIGMLIIWISKKQLGRNYSPCLDSFVPFDINAKGMYRTIRHPIYLGNIILYVGFGIVCGSVFVWAFAATIIYFFNRSAGIEESVLSAKFPEYAEYMKKTGRFFPRLGRR